MQTTPETSTKKPAFCRSYLPRHRRDERGVTMILVALAMIAIIAMAALSIDVVTLYLDREEAQRAADAAALAAARVISVSGITTNADPSNDTAAWQSVCGTAGTATLIAQAVGSQNAVGGVASSTPTITYSAQGSLPGVSDCSTLARAFAINPTVIVQVQRTGLPTLFSRIWSRSSNTVSATAMAEAFNPSDSETIDPGGQNVPVVPRCVKPWIIPDIDPKAGGVLVHHHSGIIQNQSIKLNGGFPGIGEEFILTNACTGTTCSTPTQGQYVPAFISTSPVVAAPHCANGANDDFQQAITGCDESTVYACGTVNGAQADMTTNRGSDISAAVQCITNIPTGNDTLDVTSYPFQIKAGTGNPIITNQAVTSSNSIMTLPIYDNGGSLTGNYPQVTILGFMQVFVNNVNSSGNMDVYILNVAGCGNGASSTLSAPGTSPVPIRLITPQ